MWGQTRWAFECQPLRGCLSGASGMSFDVGCIVGRTLKGPMCVPAMLANIGWNRRVVWKRGAQQWRRPKGDTQVAFPRSPIVRTVARCCVER